MTIPKKIKIGGHWFKIVYKHEYEDAYDKSGSRFSWSNKIFLQSDMEQSKKESVLFHEILHELSWQHHLDLSEAVAASIAEGMYQVLKDNRFLK